MFLTFENGYQLFIQNEHLIHDIVLQGFIQDFPGTESIPLPIYSFEEAKIYYDYMIYGKCKCTMTI